VASAREAQASLPHLADRASRFPACRGGQTSDYGIMKASQAPGRVWQFDPASFDKLRMR